MVYQDFDLLIDRKGESLRAQVLNSPAGQASAEFRLPFSDDKLENYLLRLGRTRRLTRRVESQEMNTAKAFGAALFDAVFSGDVKACFRSSLDEVRRHNAGLRIRLRLGDPAMADLPWEFLYNRSVNRFIALSVHTPLVRYMDLPERIQPIAVKPPIRVLVMIASPTDYPALDVEAEWTRLNESLKDRISAGQLAIDRLDAASLPALQRRLRRDTYHIFHFIGHGEFDQELQEGVLILEGENQRGHRVDSQYLGMLLHDHESLRVAILNACEGARTSRTDPFAGSAQSLVQQGIPAVIAMQFEIADDVASRFAHEFYGALADGYPIDASLTEARKSIFAAGREVEWGTPVLYLRAPDGRIFDIEARAPSPAPVESGPKPPRSSNLDQDKLASDVVAAAHAAFAAGQHRQAIEMLRRFRPSRDVVADALRQLTAEHQRQEENRRAGEERAREIDREDALTRSRIVIEKSVASGDLDHAEEELKRADESYGPRAEFADLRAHVLELRRQAELRQDRLADEAIGRAREELSKSPANAIELLERFSPPHPRVTAALRELQELIAEQNEQAIREAERRGEEERERQRNKEQRRRDLQQAVERIRVYLDHEELPEATAALQAAEDTFGPVGVFEEFRARLRSAERRLQENDAAGSVVGRGRNLAAAGDYAGALDLLEEFQPRHPDVVAAVESLRQERDGSSELRQSRLHGLLSQVGQPRFLLTVAAVSLIAAVAIWLLPRAFTPRKPPASPAASPPGSALARTEPAGKATLPSVQASAPAGTAGLAPAAGNATHERPAVAPEAPVVAPVAAPAPATPAPDTPASAKPGVPDDKTVADYMNRIQALLVKNDPHHALSTLTDALAYAPRDPGLRTIGVRVVEQAQASAAEARSRALAHGASGLAKFTQADRTAQRARTLSREGKTAASARTYLEAADMFASATTESLARRVPSRADRRANDVPDPAADSPATTQPSRQKPDDDAAAVAPPAPRSAGPTGRGDSSVVPAPRSRPPVDPVIDAYALAMTRGDRQALLAVYPTAPAELLAGLGRKAPGVVSYTMRIGISRSVYDDSGRAHVSVTVLHETTRTTGGREEREERRVLELERRGESWVLVEILPR